LALEVDEEGAGQQGAPDPLPSRRSWRDVYAWVVVAAGTVFCLGPSLVGARTLISVDTLTNFLPWRANGFDGLGHEACSGDTVDSVMPGIAYFRRELFSGHLPNWQNIVAGGSPLGSVPDLGLLNPLSLPYFVLPLSVAPAFVVLLSWVVAIGGTYLFLRRFHVSRFAATMAGFIFATSGFMVMWTNWPQTRVAAWIPALFWALERLISRRRPLDLVLFGAILASMLLGGFPVVTGYTLYMAAAYLIVRVWILYRGSLREGVIAVAMAAGGVLLGGALSALQMLPFLKWYEIAPLSYRSGDALLGLPNSSLFTLVSPNANGLCLAGKSSGVNGSPIELVSYIGAAALVLAVAGAAFGLVRLRPGDRGVRGFFVGAVVIILLLGWASPTARHITASLPIFADNVIGRIRSVLGFGLAVLAALGLDWITSAGAPKAGLDAPPAQDGLGARASRAGVSRAWPWVVWIGAAVAGVLVVRAANRNSFAGHYHQSLVNTSRIPVLLLGVALVIVALRRVSPSQTRVLAAVVIPVLVVAQGSQFFHAVLPGDDPANFYPDTPTHEFLESHLGHDRYTASNMDMYPATSLYYGIRTPTGHAFHEPQWVDLLQRVDPNVMLTPTFSDFGPSLNQDTVANQPILDDMGVKYFVASPDDLAGTAEPVPPAVGSLSSADGPVACSVPGQPIRGVTVRLGQALVPSVPSKGVTVLVTVKAAGETISSGRFLTGGAPAGMLLSIAVAGEGLTNGGRLALSFSESGARGPLVVSGTGTTAACAPVTPRSDGLKLVFADPASIVYQRLTALPRIRWASSAVVIPAAAARLSALAHGIPGDQVVLSRPGPPGSGRAAGVTVTADSGDQIAAQVNAAGGGYLVVADAMQEPGWSATVDGKAARLVPADHAMVAVFVPAGHHQVSIKYSAPGQLAGFAISAVAIVISVTIVAWEVWRRRRRPGESPGQAPDR
jgi:Bacterial membrane protein YfhO